MDFLDGLFEPVLNIGSVALRQFLEDDFFARIMRVDRRRRDADLLGDLPNVGSMETLPGKELESRFGNAELALFHLFFRNSRHDVVASSFIIQGDPVSAPR